MLRVFHQPTLGSLYREKILIRLLSIPQDMHSFSSSPFFEGIFENNTKKSRRLENQILNERIGKFLNHYINSPPAPQASLSSGDLDHHSGQNFLIFFC